MDQQTYSVILTGKVKDGFQLEDVIRTAAALFKCSEDKARSMFSGKPLTLKKDLAKVLAEKYLQQLLKIGIACQLAPQAQSGGLSLESPTPGGGLTLAAGPVTAKATPTPPAPAAATAATHGHSAPAPAEEEETVDEFQELMTFVGDHSDGYRQQFIELDENGGKFKPYWHWAAFLITFPWLIHRKLYLPALAYLLLGGLLYLLLPAPLTLILIFIGPALTAHYLYFLYARRKVRGENTDGSAREQRLAELGGSNTLPITAAICIGTVVLSWILISVMAVGIVAKDVDLGAVVQEAKSNQQMLEQLHDPNEQATLAGMMLVKTTYSLFLMSAKVSGQNVTAPESMDGLKQMLQMQDEMAVDAWSHPLTLENRQGVLTLRSAGIDGQLDTDDDIKLAISK